MSNVTVSAPRTPHDLSHLVCTAGGIGGLKVLSTTLVLPGDSIEINTVGSFRLSPLKRGLALDTKLEIFSFYIPHRHIYGDDYVQMMKDGPNSDYILPTYDLPGTTGVHSTSYLGLVVPDSRKCPKYLVDGYLQIYNNYFKKPYAADSTGTPSTISDTVQKYGFPCNHLKNMWSAPLNPATLTSSEVSADGTLDIMNLNAAYGSLHSEQERTAFMSRYRDVISSFGGKTTIDADNRPQLLVRSQYWTSGYDVDGTDQTSLGQFSGRVIQNFSHRVPRWYVPEHGAIITLALVRFPAIPTQEVPFFAGNPSIDYSILAGDPAIIGNEVPYNLNVNHILNDVSGNILIPYGQWYRYQPSHIDAVYDDLEDFPFIDSYKMSDSPQNQTVDSTVYDDVFQTTQMYHWNAQMKFNVTAYRRVPDARDSLFTE